MDTAALELDGLLSKRPATIGRSGAFVAVVCAALCFTRVDAQDDPKDWPMYNRDVIGTRYNRGETAIGKSNVGRLEDFPMVDRPRLCRRCNFRRLCFPRQEGVPLGHEAPAATAVSS